MMPFIDLEAQQQRIKPKIDAAIERVLAHGQYIMGPEVRQLETALSEYTGSRHAITVSDGTNALILALMAWGVGPGDAVITSPFTFYATVEALQMLGARPVFSDIDPLTYNLCPRRLETTIQATRAQGEFRLRGIIPVDLFGLAADYPAIQRIAAEHELFVLQDAAQGFGALCDDRMAPVHGDIGTTSFFPAKPLGCYGDGGAVFTDDDQLADLIRSLRIHGKGTDKYDNVRVGKNSRLDTLQAAILLEKLAIYDSEIEARQQVAQHYSSAINDLNRELGQPVITPPVVPAGYRSVWAQYTIRVPRRNDVSAQLQTLGIPSVVYYRTPAHLLGACSGLGYRAGDFPDSEQASTEVLSLPFHPYLDSGTVDQVVAGLRTAIQST